MEKIVGDITVKKGKNCFYSCLYNIASYYGCQILEADIFFLCHGLDCWYQEVKEKKFSSDNLSFHSYDMQTNWFAKEMGVYVETAYDQEREANQLAIEMALLAGQPIIVMIKPSALSYHPMDENIENSCHCIFLYGIDLKNKEVYMGDAFVIDSKGKVTVFNGKYPLDTILEGMIGYAWFTGKWKSPDKSRITTKMIRQLSGYINAEEHTGIQAWEQYFNRFGKCSLQAADYMDLIYLLQVRGSYVFKYLMQFLEREDKENEEIQKILSELQQLEEHWNTFIVKILIVSQTISEKSERRAVKAGMEVLKEQKNVYQNIVSYLQGKQAVINRKREDNNVY